uniref:Uncharacterized protein n=1 Tax=Avena sativa TaxID=4498 RepID=A0ACD5ZT88_AVESA
MPRWSPPPPRDGEHFFPLGSHDAGSLSLFVACVAATVVIASSMCSACGRKPKAVSQEPDAAAAAADAKADDVEEEVVTLPPELAIHGPIVPAAPAASRRKLSVSMSLSHAHGIAKNLANIPDKMRLSKRERKEKQDAPEDTLWKKAIILGEKCKIPGEREGEVSDPDAVAEAADEMAAGTFRRSSYSRPMSRSNSFAVNQPLPEPPGAYQSSNS